ncbi:PilZ domain-containing protein [Sphingomonas tabacisoli]|uniref:PilZ domain-containing protein n=1 Tax=Sphingomonas tabacisoli TaxID=2249466 RepID=A0ABW4I523_9SPHN
MSLITRTRTHMGEDQRQTPREEEKGRFAGLGIRGRYHIVTMHNLSAGGACLQMPVEPVVGERVKITSGTLNRVGRVCWFDGTRGGVEFE